MRDEQKTDRRNVTTALPAEPKKRKRAKKASGVEHHLQERNNETAELAAALPADRSSLLTVAAEAVRACHEAVLAGDEPAALMASSRYDAAVWKLNGGTFQGCKDGADPDAAGTVIEQHCRAAPGEIPMWGQSGEFLVAVGDVRALVEVGDGYGSLMDRSFEFHAVDLDGPFISETGYRSHFASADGKATVAEVATAIFADLLKGQRRYLTAEAQNRLAEQPQRPWLSQLSDPPRHVRAIEATTAPLVEDAIPAGFVLVDVVLTEHQAFIVKKWAKAAQARLKASKAVEPPLPTMVDARKKTVALPLAALGDGDGPDTTAFRKGVRCEIVRVHHAVFNGDVGKKIIVTRVSADTRQVWAHADEPIRYKINRNGRRVVASDPRCIETIYSMDALRIL